jgi:hypothetical protein
MGITLLGNLCALNIYAALPHSLRLIQRSDQGCAHDLPQKNPAKTWKKQDYFTAGIKFDITFPAL